MYMHVINKRIIKILPKMNYLSSWQSIAIRSILGLKWLESDTVYIQQDKG